MNEAHALKLIEGLAGGIQPFTGEGLEPDHLCQHPDVVRALCLAARALEERKARRDRNRDLPANVGKHWGRAESEQLLIAFQAGKSYNEIAHELQRTASGVQARLERMGLVAPVPHRWPVTPLERPG